MPLFGHREMSYFLHYIKIHILWSFEIPEKNVDLIWNNDDDGLVFFQYF